MLALGTAAVAGRAAQQPRDAPAENAPVACETPYSDALGCLAQFTATRPVRVVVGPIAERGIRQDASAMTKAALAKAGVPFVEHIATAVASAAQNDGGILVARAVPGADFYLAGAVSAEPAEYESRTFRVDLGMELSLVDLDTRQRVDVIQYQRAITGEIGPAGMLNFLGRRFAHTDGDRGARAPVVLAMRSAIERAVLELVSRLYGVPQNACASQLGGPDDPLAGLGDRPPQNLVASRGIGIALSYS